MKYLVILFLPLLIVFSGCSGSESFAAGAGASGIVQAIQEQAQEEQIKEFALQQELVAKLKVSNSAAEDALLAAELEKSYDRHDNALDRQNASESIDKLLGIDYKDPESLIPVLVGVLLAYLNLRKGKENITLSAILEATNKGMSRYGGRASPEEAGMLYDTVKHEKRKAGLLKEITAVLD